MGSNFLFPTWTSRFEDAAWLLLRVYLGAFLIWGVWDNLVFAERMQEFVTFLTQVRCPLPEIAAPVSVWVQFGIGLALIGGVATRWAGALLTANFVVATALLAGAGQGLRELYSPMILVFVGLLLAAHGAGRLSLDRLLEDDASPRGAWRGARAR